MNNAQSAKYWLERAEAQGNNESIQSMSLQAIGHALLAIHGELVKKDEVLPSLPSLESMARDCGFKLELKTGTCVAKDETVDNTPWVPPLSPVGTGKEPIWFGEAPVVDDEEVLDGFESP